MLLSELYKHGVSLLRESSGEEASLEASLFLSFILGIPRTSVLISGDKTISQVEKERFLQCIQQRRQRIPLAYIIGEQEFWSLEFYVNPDVLIPRGETEVLVEHVLDSVTSFTRNKLKIIDFGTGSGAIAVVLAKEIPHAIILAIDKSYAAIRVAARNRNRHCVHNQVKFLCGDWGSSLIGEEWDIVVSNPPYIDKRLLQNLQTEVTKEPALALDGGAFGMESIGMILNDGARLLRSGGLFFMEIGYDQKEMIHDVFRERDDLDLINIFPDLAGLPRVVKAQKKTS